MGFDRCPQHPEHDPVFVLTPTMIHYGKKTCPVCGRFITWVAKPENANKKRRPPQDHLGWLFEDEHVDYCQVCMRPRQALPRGTVLDVHHIVEVQDGGTNDRANLLLLCNVCHRIVHELRRYRVPAEESATLIAEEAHHA